MNFIMFLDKKMLMRPDQNVSIRFGNNIYIEKYWNSLAHEDLM